MLNPLLTPLIGVPLKAPIPRPELYPGIGSSLEKNFPEAANSDLDPISPFPVMILRNLSFPELRHLLTIIGMNCASVPDGVKKIPVSYGRS